MDHDEARHLLLMHGTGTFDADPGWLEDGFLGMLRPYRGLRETNFHVVLEALFVVGQRLSAGNLVDRELTHSLWSMCRLARLWGVDPDGMLQRNKLISQSDTTLLQRWIDIVEYGALHMLSGRPPYQEVNSYAEYVIEYGPGDNVDFFIPLMCQYLDDPDSVDPEPIPQALGKLGRRAVQALPSLHAASSRKYADYCHADAQAAIEDAIRRIAE